MNNNEQQRHGIQEEPDTTFNQVELAIEAIRKSLQVIDTARQELSDAHFEFMSEAELLQNDMNQLTKEHGLLELSLTILTGEEEEEQEQKIEKNKKRTIAKNCVNWDDIHQGNCRCDLPF